MFAHDIAGPQFNTALARCTQAETPSEFEAAKAHLMAFINGWGAGLGHKAVEEFKAVCRFQDQVAVDEKKLNDLETKMLALASSSADGLFDTDVQWLSAGVGALKRDTFDNKLEVPKDLTPDFTIKDDEDLNELLNASVALVVHGGMDLGIHWSDCLERVLKRLKAERRHSVLDTLTCPESEEELAKALRTLSEAHLGAGVWDAYVMGDFDLNVYLTNGQAEPDENDESAVDLFLNDLCELFGTDVESIFGPLKITDYSYQVLLREIWNVLVEEQHYSDIEESED